MSQSLSADNATAKTLKNAAAIVGMALCSVFAAGQLNFLIGTQRALQSGSVALIALTTVAGLLLAFSSFAAVGLAVRVTRR